MPPREWTQLALDEIGPFEVWCVDERRAIVLDDGGRAVDVYSCAGGADLAVERAEQRNRARRLLAECSANRSALRSERLDWKLPLRRD